MRKAPQAETTQPLSAAYTGTSNTSILLLPLSEKKKKITHIHNFFPIPATLSLKILLARLLIAPVILQTKD